MRVIWSPTALRQLARIFEYLDELNPRAALQVSASMVTVADSLESFPHRGRPAGKTGVRELVTIYPYVIRYRVTRDEVRILRVRHTSRLPTDR
jgi:toxin ParE1/3/4